MHAMSFLGQLFRSKCVITVFNPFEINKFL